MKASIVAVLAAVAAVNAGHCEDTHASCLLSLDLDIPGVLDLSLDICTYQYNDCCAKSKSTLSQPATTSYTSISTVTSTHTNTISKCPSSVTSCPYETKPVTTEVVETYTTECPVTETQVPGTISTVTTTSTCTISTCAPEITSCPYEHKPTTVITTYEIYTPCPTTVSTSVPATSKPATTTPCPETSTSVISVPEKSKPAYTSSTTPCPESTVVSVPGASKPAGSAPAGSAPAGSAPAVPGASKPAGSAPAVPGASKPAVQVPASNNTTPYQQASGADTVARFGASALFVVAAGAMML